MLLFHIISQSILLRLLNISPLYVLFFLSRNIFFLVMQMQQDVTSGHADPIRRTQRPRALVLVPTRELAVQVLEVAKKLSRTCKFSSCGVIGGEDYGKQKKQLAGTVDVVVASPGEFFWC